MEPGLAPALLEAGALAARSALLGGAAFLLTVSSPLARRLPAGQAAMLMGRTQLFLRAAALSTMTLAALQLAAGQFAGLGVLLAALAVLLLAPREGPSPRLALVLLFFASLAMLLAVSGGRPGQFTPRSLTTATLLREAGAALWMGNLPLLWMLLRAPGPASGSGWPASVPQVVGMRHAALMLLGMGLTAVGLAIAWPHRGLLFGAAAFPLLAITAGFVVLAQLAAALRVMLLIEAGRAAPASLWLPRLRCVVECELLLAIVLCGPIVALFVLAAQGLSPAAAPDLAALLPRFRLHAFGPAEVAGLVLMLIAVSAWLRRAEGALNGRAEGALNGPAEGALNKHAEGGLTRHAETGPGTSLTRFGPLLLLPLGAGLALEAESAPALSLGVLVLLSGLAEAWVLWRGEAGGLGMVLPFAVILGIVLILAGNPPAEALLPCLLATLALLIRWAELRLPAPRDRLVAAIAWPFALGALGLVLLLAHGR
ncbi:hypothetical protein [Sediminicoccus sp. KRV36]|uniref:hypothetical protein n=1 Tax=Sediminicoccus sp. KRV36 TaxID=3133721 RepID=UPI0020107C7E|nr:hypothetical protein [Sediminicoccus rosea]UPY35785.1 hypothetical protein LHU95_16340 [Sediminicoccus rosea]